MQHNNLPIRPLQHCCCQWEGGNSLACQCSYTYEFLQFLQPCRMAEMKHSNHG